VNVELVERRKVRVDDAAIIWQRIVIVGNIRVEHMLLLCIQLVESGECLIVDVYNPKMDGISAAKRLGAAGVRCVDGLTCF
jgi:CheY-like chemotaxis protein